jgi:hypothetical protein
MPGPKPGMEARVNLFGDPGRTFHGVVQGIAWRVLPLSGQTLRVFPKIDPTLNWARLHNAFRCGSSSTHPPRHPVKLLAEDFPANGRIGEPTRRSALAAEDVAIAARFPLPPVVVNWNYTRAIADSSVEPKFGQPAALLVWNTDRRPPAHLRAARLRTGSRGRIRCG